MVSSRRRRRGSNNNDVFCSGGGVPNILHQVSVPVMDNDSCQEMFDTSGHKKKIRESFLCAGYKEGEKDSCEVSNSVTPTLQSDLNCVTLPG